MADLRAFERTVTLGGEDRTLRIDFNAIAELDGVGLDVMNDPDIALNARTIRALTWAALVARQMYVEGRRYRQPEVALHEVGGWLSDPDAQAEVTAAIAELYEQALGDDEEVADAVADATEGEGDAEGEAGKESDSATSKPSPSSTSD